MQKKTPNEFYESPLTTVFEVRQEGVICGYGGTEAYNLGENYGETLFD